MSDRLSAWKARIFDIVIFDIVLFILFLAGIAKLLYYEVWSLFR